MPASVWPLRKHLSTDTMAHKPRPTRVILAVTNDLVTDQRVHRSCMALHQAGYHVTLVGRLLPESLPLQRPYRTHRMRLLFRKKAVFYAEYNLRLFLFMLFSRAHIFYANDTDTLPAAFLAARLSGRKLFFDAHEMFPEVPELASRPRIKAVWTSIENLLIPRVDGAVTVCRSIADIYSQRYHIHMDVVRNVPLRDAEAPAPSHPLPAHGRKVLLYQGAVNLGRGIEPMIAAMHYLPDCLFVIAGIGDKYRELQAEVQRRQLSDRILFLGRLPLEELRSVTAQAHLGISFLENLGLNYYYSLPNRIADFVQARVPVIATDFPEIRSVVQQYQIGTLVPPEVTALQSYQPEQLADIIRSTLAHWDSVDALAKEQIFHRAAAQLSWQHDSAVLLASVAAIRGPRH